MKNLVKKILVRLDIYLPLRYSFFYRIYVTLFQKNIIAAEKKEVAFYRSFLNKCDLIFDIGAYDGHKTAAFLHFANRVICCEPDPLNYSILRARFRSDKKVIIQQVALSNTISTKQFFIHHPGSAFNTFDSKWKNILENEGQQKFNETFHFSDGLSVTTTTLDDLIAKFGIPDFIKIDVEGHEKFVLEGLSTRINYLSIEANLPYFRQETIECLQMLQTLHSDSLYNYSIDEKLQLPEFVGHSKFLNIFISLADNSCEIICRMNVF
ncbi:MAG TPA: FkbM family methyltransferase [Puia sp.]|nr:FkbM family methyltransferase [Puia sp.]